MNLILLRKRNETQLVETKYEEDLPEENHETSININNNDTDNNGVVDEQAEELTEVDKELEQFFQIHIKAMDHCTLLQLESHEKLPKKNLTKESEAVQIEFLVDI